MVVFHAKLEVEKQKRLAKRRKERKERRKAEDEAARKEEEAREGEECVCVCTGEGGYNYMNVCDNMFIPVSSTSKT